MKNLNENCNCLNWDLIENKYTWSAKMTNTKTEIK